MRLLLSFCIFRVFNALLMPSAAMIMRAGGGFWLKPVARVLFILCNVVLVDWFHLKRCCV